MLKEKSKNLLAGMLMFLMVTKFYIVYFEFASVSKFLMLFSLVLSTILIIDNRKSYNWVHLAFLASIYSVGCMPIRFDTKNKAK